MTISRQTFHCLSLCARPIRGADHAVELAAALETPTSWDELVDQAEQHGLEPLLLGHLRAARIAIPQSAQDRLRARSVQHAHASAVRDLVIIEIVRALEGAGIPMLVLKGAALARLVYANPALRPMRDVDLLVPKAAARQAWAALEAIGFSAGGTPVGPSHHHLQGLSTTLNGATITVELHTELFARTPFIKPLQYEELCRTSQTFEGGGVTLRTLSREDMLWHVYAHAFVINVFCRGIRLISVADLVHATDAWADVLDWHELGWRYRRMARALPRAHQLTCRSVRPLDAPTEWWGALHRDVLWPPEWWFAMRYGIQGLSQWTWFRFIGHPAHLAAAAADAVRRRVPSR